MAAILSSRSWPPGRVRSTQTPTRPLRRSPFTLKAARVCDDPVFQRADELLHVAAALGEVEHHIGHALAGAVIGELAAALGVEDGEAGGVQEVAVLGAGAPRVERRVLQQPDQLVGLARGDGGGARFHGRHGVGVAHQTL